MKRFIMISAALFIYAAIALADDRPVKFDQLPEAARTFLNANFPTENILIATKENDVFYPDYNVTLENGVHLEFYSNGALKTVESRGGVPDGLVPVQIVEFVKVRYPDARIIEYDVAKHHFDVELSNGIELKFNRNYNLMKIDD